jgi:hypothetical protein
MMAKFGVVQQDGQSGIRQRRAAVVQAPAYRSTRQIRAVVSDRGLQPPTWITQVRSHQLGEQCSGIGSEADAGV